MNIVRKLLRLARALDWAKDPDPDHWKTINGAKVHLDANGNYDGGAGGRFNGKHHYGPGYKEKQNTPKRRPASEIVLGARNPNVKGLSEAVLRERMKKATNYGDWNRVRGEIHRRLREKEHDLKMKFNAAYGKPEQKEIREALNHHQVALHQFEQESRIPYKFIEEAFNRNPKAAQKAYESKKFLNNEFYPAYEKWKAKKERTTSIMKNLAKSLKGTNNGAPNPYPHGATVDMGGGSSVKCRQVAGSPNKILIDSGMGFEIKTFPGGLHAFLEKMKAAGYQVSASEPQPQNSYVPLPGDAGRTGRVSRQQSRAMSHGRPHGSQ